MKALLWIFGEMTRRQSPRPPPGSSSAANRTELGTSARSKLAASCCFLARLHTEGKAFSATIPPPATSPSSGGLQTQTPLPSQPGAFSLSFSGLKEIQVHCPRVPSPKQQGQSGPIPHNETESTGKSLASAEAAEAASSSTSTTLWQGLPHTESSRNGLCPGIRCCLRLEPS